MLSELFLRIEKETCPIILSNLCNFETKPNEDRPPKKWALSMITTNESVLNKL